MKIIGRFKCPYCHKKHLYIKIFKWYLLRQCWPWIDANISYVSNNDLRNQLNNIQKSVDDIKARIEI